MRPRNSRQHRRVVVRLGAQQENGAVGRHPLRKRRETEVALLDPVYFDPIPASGFQLRLIDVHHCNVPARPGQSATERDSDASRADDIYILHST